MQQIVILSLSFLSLGVFAQEPKEKQNVTRFEYAVSAKKSKKDLDRVSSGICALDIVGDAMVFYDTENYKRNYARMNAKPGLSPQERGAITLGFRPVFTWIVVSQGDENRFYDDLNKDLFYVIKEPKEQIKWEINPQVESWNEYSVQQATTSYGGREWTVLFTQDIPVQSGPYVFTNLPGMVVKAWDSQEHYVFELLSGKSAELDWQVLALDKYSENSRKTVDKAIKINDNKTGLQMLEDKGIKIGEAGRAGLSSKIGDSRNDIYMQ
ncbi:GLPGLI family protein [Myroides sp. LJL116]